MYIISTFIAKSINKLVNIFRLGSGHTWPGHLVLSVYPRILEHVKKKLPNKVVLISGTNGKTTTAKLIMHIFEHNSMRVLHNDTGANLINGVVSSVLLSSDIRGRLDFDIAVFELDEFTLPSLLESISPSVLVLLNLSRDQLDRHWEVDIVLEKWEQALDKLPPEASLVLDKAQDRFEPLAKKYKGKVLYFDEVKEDLALTKLKGSYNAKNVNCALLVAEELGVGKEEARKSLGSFKHAFGRGEFIKYGGKEWQILLAKNPESVNQNLKMLLEEDVPYDALMYILNDNIPDGLDVSWIYDVKQDRIRKACAGKTVFVSGKRALDMAVRLQYAGVDITAERISTSLSNVAGMIIDDNNVSSTAVLPNYSAMLDIRKVLTGRKIL